MVFVALVCLVYLCIWANVRFGLLGVVLVVCRLCFVLLFWVAPCCLTWIERCGCIVLPDLSCWFTCVDLSVWYFDCCGVFDWFCLWIVCLCWFGFGDLIWKLFIVINSSYLWCYGLCCLLLQLRFWLDALSCCWFWLMIVLMMWFVGWSSGVVWFVGFACFVYLWYFACLVGCLGVSLGDLVGVSSCGRLLYWF